MRFHHLLGLVVPALVSAACSESVSESAASSDNALAFEPDQAHWVIEHYPSASSDDTGVDEWDVAVVQKDNANITVARGYDPSRNPVVDVVLPTSGDPIVQQAGADAPLDGLSDARLAALVSDMNDLQGSANWQAALNGQSSACGSASATAATGLAQGASLAAATPDGDTVALGSSLDSAQHACPVQTGALTVAPLTDVGDGQGPAVQSSLQDFLNQASGFKSFLERNRALVASAVNAGTQNAVGFFKCLLSQFGGVYAYGDLEIPLGGVISYAASKGLPLSTDTWAAAAAKVPALNTSPNLEVLAYGGAEFDDGGADPAAGMVFAVDVFKFFVPLTSIQAYASTGVEMQYDFGSKTWEGPSWVGFAGEIPLWVGIPLGLGVYTTAGDDVGFFINFEVDLAGHEASTGVIVQLSKSSLGAFWSALEAGNFVNGCSPTNNSAPAPSAPAASTTDDDDDDNSHSARLGAATHRRR